MDSMDEDEESDEELNKISKKELIRTCKSKLSLSTKPTGSAPDNSDSGSHSTASDDEVSTASTADSSSDSSSGSSAESEEAGGGTHG